MKLIKDFYYKVFKNLSSNKKFYNYYDEQYSYSDILKSNFIFKNFLKKNKIKEETKFCIISEKIFENYSLIVSLMLTNNIWIPLSNNNPIKRNLEIIKIIKPKVVFVDKQNYNYLKKIVKNNLKIKIILLEEFFSL